MQLSQSHWVINENHFMWRDDIYFYIKWNAFDSSFHVHLKSEAVRSNGVHEICGDKHKKQKNKCHFANNVQMKTEVVNRVHKGQTR